MMYYSSIKQMELTSALNIHHTTFTKHLNNGTYYLNKYVFSREIVGGAIAVEMKVDEIKAMFERDRALFNKNKPMPRVAGARPPAPTKHL